MLKRIMKTRPIILLNPLRERGIADIEERGGREREREQEREKIEINLLFMMRAGPVSAQETHPVPAFQHK